MEILAAGNLAHDFFPVLSWRESGVTETVFEPKTGLNHQVDAKDNVTIRLLTRDDDLSQLPRLGPAVADPTLIDRIVTRMARL